MGFLRKNKTRLVNMKVAKSAVFLLLIVGFFVFVKTNLVNAKDFNFGVTGDRIFLNGNVGIGTTAPVAKLDVNTSGNNAIQSYGTNEGSFNARGQGGYLTMSTYGTTARFGYQTSGYNSATTQLVLDSTGNVGIGTTAPTNRLIVVSADNTPGAIITALPANLSQGTRLTYRGLETISGLMYIDAFTNQNIAMQTQSSGNVGIGDVSPQYKLAVSGDIKATGFVYSSDQSLKQNINPINDPLNKIMQLRGVTFNWKKDNTPSVGLIAQEVEKVFPELVTGTEGNKGVQYGNLVAPLIEAVKAQQKEIEDLKAQQTELVKTLQQNSTQLKASQNSINTLSTRLKTLEVKSKKK